MLPALVGSLFAMHAAAQDEIVPSLVVAASKMNILYSGVENPLEIVVPGVLCENVRISVSQGVLSGSSCSYTVRPEQGNKLLTVEAHWHEASEERTAIRHFRVKEIPLPEPCFAGQCGLADSVALDQVRNAQGLIARLVDFDVDLHIRVEHYRLTLLRNCITIFDGTSAEARATMLMKQALSETRSGDTLQITDIRASYPDGVGKALRPLRLVVR
jgi:hypothetical protein